MKKEIIGCCWRNNCKFHKYDHTCCHYCKERNKCEFYCHDDINECKFKKKYILIKEENDE